MKLLTRAGWQDRDYIDWDVDLCNECDEPAEVIVEAGRDILWACCEGHAEECEIARIDSIRQRHDDME